MTTLLNASLTTLIPSDVPQLVTGGVTSASENPTVILENPSSLELALIGFAMIGGYTLVKRYLWPHKDMTAAPYVPTDQPVKDLSREAA